MEARGTGVYTLDKYRDAARRNYCTLPTINVEILEPVRRCAGCGGEIVLRVDKWKVGRWEHVEDRGDCTWARAESSCTYCGATGEAVTFHQQAWSDETHCARCGGVNGYGIGD